MSVKADCTALVSFKDIGKSKFQEGEGIGTFGSIAFKRVVNDVTYIFRTTDTTFKQLRALNGATLSVARPFGPVAARGVLDLGPVKTLAGELSSKFKYHKGKTLELKALWSEKANATTLTATAQLLSNLKLRNTLNSRTKAVVSDAEVAFKGFTIAPAVNWQKQEKGITLSRKVGRGTLKSSYAVDRQLAALEYNFKPYKVAVSSRTSGALAGKPTVSLSFDKTLDLSGIRKPKDSCCGKVEDVPLDRKLKELDAAYEPRLAKARAQKEKAEKKAAKK